MNPDFVADVGNSRIKWGRCSPHSVLDGASLPAEDPAAWQHQLEQWGVTSSCQWLLTGVHPSRRDRLANWLRERGHRVTTIEGHRQLPLRIDLENPETVGIDRLLNAVAANARRPEGSSVIVVDAGTAVTVDFVNEKGVFRGGAILPGLRLMARSLHEYTALLPLVEPIPPLPDWPGLSTVAAIEAGVFWAVAGGILALINRGPTHPLVFLTGGDAALLAPALGEQHPYHLWPLMTLEGIRLAGQEVGQHD